METQNTVETILFAPCSLVLLGIIAIVVAVGEAIEGVMNES